MGTLLLLPLSDDDGPTGLVEPGRHPHPRHQGQGMATEAARAVLDLAGQTGIDQVLALTDLDNIASQRVATRLGMRDEGVTGRWFGLTVRQYRKVLSVPADQHDGGHGQQDGRQDDEDAGLDALERPEPAGGLVGDEGAESGERRPAG